MHPRVQFWYQIMGEILAIYFLRIKYYQSLGCSTFVPVNKISRVGLSDILTHRGVVGHSLQLLNYIYIQQLKGQQVLGKKQTNGQC